MSTTVETPTEIRPFHVDISPDKLADLHQRIAATRWPHKELVADRSQGVQLATGTPSTVVQPQDALVRLPMPRGGNRPASRWIRHLPAPGATFNGSTRAFAPIARRQPGTAVVF